MKRKTCLLLVFVLLVSVVSVYGTAVMQYRGDWLFTDFYSSQDVVRYKTFFYISLQGSQGMTPDISPDYWLCLTCPVGGGKKR